MSAPLDLVSLDVGSTTCRAGFARARVRRAGRGGRFEVGDVEERLRPEPVLTPFDGDRLDEAALLERIERWFEAAQVEPARVFGGGALLTGLAARAPNASAVAQALRSRLGDAVVATADDPRLEAWLAFQGSVGAWSRAHPSRTVLNADIGGGTTSLALGRSGEVLATGWLWVGARHLIVEAGSYRMVRCSPEGRAALVQRGISKGPGDELSRAEVEAVVDLWVERLEAAVAGGAAQLEGPWAPAEAMLPAGGEAVAVAFSGGVGELIHACRAGRPLPGTTPWGDLGIELARRIAGSPVLGAHPVAPQSPGRATLCGLLKHQTQVAGATVFLPPEGGLPLGDLPLVGSLGAQVQQAELERVLALARAAPRGAAVAVRPPVRGVEVLRGLGKALGAALRGHPEGRPLVVLLPENAGKALGGYATDWGRTPRPLVVLDELAPGDAQFIHLGRPRDGIIPVSFHGLRQEAPPPCSP